MISCPSCASLRVSYVVKLELIRPVSRAARWARRNRCALLRNKASVVCQCIDRIGRRRSLASLRLAARQRVAAVVNVGGLAAVTAAPVPSVSGIGIRSSGGTIAVP
jgi:hypothetical protein